MFKFASFLLFAGMFLLVNRSSAQYKIIGNVSGEDGSAAAISVTITNKDNFSKITRTDILGRFIFNDLKKDNYLLLFSSVDFGEIQHKLLLAADTVISVKLEKSAIELQNVEIRSTKALIEKRVDRTIFNVNGSVAAIGSDALELMSKVPGIRVVNDRVSLVGKGSINIMINDKLTPLSEDDLANYLRSIPSDHISRIEVITNPSAKYDAQGNNGLINIVLKKSVAEGFKGAVNLGFTQATHHTGSGGGNLSFRKDKITLFTNFNFRKGSTVPFEQSSIFYPTQTWNIVNKDRNFRIVPSGQLGLDYQISKNTIAGISYNAGLTDFHSEENIKTTVFNKAGAIDSLLNSDANAKIKSNYKTANFYLKQLIDTMGKQLVINADWFKYRDDNQRFFDNTTYNQDGGIIPGSFAQYLSSSGQNIDLYTLKADVDLPYKAFTLSLGAKASFIKNKSDVSFYRMKNDIYEIDNSQTNLFNYTENTQALYFNLNKTINNWDFQMGLRAEYTQIEGVSVNSTTGDDYLRLFPTLFISYRKNEESEFSLNYGRRINRPAYKKLNPFRWYSNQYSYAEGNPFLRPSYNNNIELSHTYSKVLTTTLSFNNTNDGYSNVNFTDVNTNIQILRPLNLITSYQYQLSNSIIFNQLKWLESVNQLDVYYVRSNSSIAQTLPGLNGFGAYFSSSNQVVFNKVRTMMGELNFWYQFPGVNELNKMKSQYRLDIGFKRLLLDNKLQLALNVSDILKSGKERYSSIVNGIGQEYKNYYDSQYLRLTVRYNFGNEKIKQQDHKPGNEEERRRSN
ncbi:hypothetical protein N180_02140 [Pedobacter antarcticus 4BY]|uniref:Outer membrane protein beta-barrel domain-containing protein n=2 Tax=Pedobacter antarcticus TaxID=34086 RepID=A0A081PCN1_9SPHI|nr:TonB-dependent receptor [Pedobacter antarcticus]KEQ28454.1 hypothetical protein N180_02140 [Pedobacter antarcticus 4BY]SFF03609.1 Outer membrane receptor proteins, mostly Fe transport [Pedobacter antarcticus]